MVGVSGMLAKQARSTILSETRSHASTSGLSWRRSSTGCCSWVRSRVRAWSGDSSLGSVTVAGGSFGLVFVTGTGTNSRFDPGSLRSPCSVRTVCQYSPMTVGTVSNCVTMPLMPGSLTLTSAPTANRFLGDGLNCCFLTAMPIV